MTGAYCTLNCVETTITDVVPDVVSLLQQINKSSSTQCVAIDLAHMFFSISIRKEDKNIHIHLERTADYIYSLDLGLY